MQKAKIFGEAVDRIISATDIKNGLIDKNHEFVDPEYEFKVIYVKGAKNNGAPHFRLYFSKRDYYKLDVERRKKYDILRNMSHFQESSGIENGRKIYQIFVKLKGILKTKTQEN